MNTRHPVEPSQGGRPQNEKAVPAVGSPPEHAQPAAWIVRKDCDELYRVEGAARSYAEIIGAQVIPLYAAPPEHADLLGDRAKQLHELQDQLFEFVKDDEHRTAYLLHCEIVQLQYALARIDTVLNREPQQ